MGAQSSPLPTAAAWHPRLTCVDADSKGVIEAAGTPARASNAQRTQTTARSNHGETEAIRWKAGRRLTACDRARQDSHDSEDTLGTASQMQLYVSFCVVFEKSRQAGLAGSSRCSNGAPP
jgi:hypothetical protein